MAADGLHWIAALRFPGVAAMWVGIPGGPVGTTGVELSDGELVPMALVAVTTKL